MIIEKPHRRYNPLTGDWVLVSPQRNQRPWLGQKESIPAENLPPYDPDCYLCPGNSRAGGKKNPRYSSTFVFDNDFPAVFPIPTSDQFEATGSENGINQAHAAGGICRVVCFTPRHDLSIPEMSLEEIQMVVSTWSRQTEELLRIEGTRYVQVFENKGEMMGCSNPHPHSQIWATDFIPNEPAKEQSQMVEFAHQTNGCLICQILDQEMVSGERIVYRNQHFSALVPFWATWPFEILLISHRHVGSLPDLDTEEIKGLADSLRQVTIRYDNLFEISFPYSMGFHQTPKGVVHHLNHHLHAHFFPPLLRSASVRKFMVGFEMLAMPQRDLTPELAARRLQEVSAIHYKLLKADNERHH